MSRVLVILLFACVAPSAYSLEVCTYPEFTHWGYATNLVAEIGNDARSRFRTAVDHLQGNYTKFTKKVAELALGELGTEVVKCTDEVTDAVKKALLLGEQVYLDEYKAVTDNGLELTKALATSVRAVLNLALSTAGKVCSPKVMKITHAKIVEADTAIRECFTDPEKVLRASIDKLSHVLDIVNSKYTTVLYKTLKDVKESRGLGETTVSALKAFQTEAEHTVDALVSLEKKVITVVKDTYLDCANGIKSSLEATAGAIVGTLFSVVGGILGGL